MLGGTSSTSRSTRFVLVYVLHSTIQFCALPAFTWDGYGSRPEALAPKIRLHLPTYDLDAKAMGRTFGCEVTYAPTSPTIQSLVADTLFLGSHRSS